jgi:hypothetical protein
MTKPSENTGNGPIPVLPTEPPDLGSGPIPVLPEDEEDVLMRRFFGPDGRRNRGGRPRKDGTRADTTPTWAEAGFSKRTAAKIRAVGNLTHEEHEAAVEKRRAEFLRGGHIIRTKGEPRRPLATKGVRVYRGRKSMRRV